jgi:hypothetical protein
MLTPPEGRRASLRVDLYRGGPGSLLPSVPSMTSAAAARPTKSRFGLIADRADILRNMMLAECGWAPEGLAGQPQDQGTTTSVGGTNANLMRTAINPVMKLRW